MLSFCAGVYEEFDPDSGRDENAVDILLTGKICRMSMMTFVLSIGLSPAIHSENSRNEKGNS